MKIALAFVVATITALLVVPATQCVALGVGLSIRGSCRESLFAYLTFGSLIAFPSVVAFGVPLYLAFRKFGLLTWWQVLLGGCLAGLFSAVALKLLSSSTQLSGTLVMFGGLGAVAGVVFWVCGVRRPNPSFKRDAAQSRSAP